MPTSYYQNKLTKEPSYPSMKNEIATSIHLCLNNHKADLLLHTSQIKRARGLIPHEISPTGGICLVQSFVQIHSPFFGTCLQVGAYH